MKKYVWGLAAVGIGCAGDDDVVETAVDTGDVVFECTELSFRGVVTATDEQLPPDADLHVAVNRVDLSADDFSLFLPDWEAPLAARLEPGGSAEFSLCLPDEPEEGSHVPDGTMEIAMYMVGAYADTDENGRPSQPDAYAGASFQYLAHTRGAPTAQFTNAGGELGWNVLDFDYSSGQYTATPAGEGIEGYELPSNLLPMDPGPLEATIKPALGLEVAIALTHTGPITGDSDPTEPELGSIAVDATSAGSSATFAELSPGDDTHFVGRLGTTALLDAELAVYAGIAYTDTNGNGTWELGTDTTHAASTSGQEAALLTHFRARGFRAAIYVERYGMGWSLLATSGARRDWSRGLVLE